MRIDGWRIDGFGVFADTVVEDLPDGLTIVSGPNEAGKSTLLAFLRGVLFGFPDGRMRARRHEPVRGGRHGGAVRLRDTDGQLWVVERHVEPRTFSLRRPDGGPAADHELNDLLGHADATLFANVFAFGLSELDGFELLDSDAVRDRVFSAGVVGAGRSAREALNTLDGRRAALLRARGRCDIRELADEARAAVRQLTQARTAAVDLGRRREEVDRIADLAEQRRAEVEECRADQHRFRALLEIWPVRSRLAVLDEELDTLDVPDGIDETFEPRFERVRAELHAATLALEEAEQDLDSAMGRRDALAESLDDALLAIAPDVVGLAGELATEEARSVRLGELEKVVVDQRTLLEEQLARLGPEWDRTHLAGFDASIPAADEVRRRGATIEGSEAEVARLRGEKAAADREHAEVASALAALEEHLDPDHAPAPEDLDRRTRALRQLRANLVDLGAESARLEAAERSVAGLHAVMPKRQPPTGSSMVGLVLLTAGVIVAVLGVAAFVGGESTLGIALGTTGGVGIVLGVVILLTRRSAIRPEDTSGLTWEIREAERSRDDAKGRVEVLRTSIHAAALVLGLPPEPSALEVEECAAAIDRTADEIRAAEGERRRVEELTAGISRLEPRRQELERALTRAAMQRDREREEWSTWTTRHRVPRDLGTEAINDLFTAIERARGTMRSLDAAEREWTRLDEASTAWRGRAAELLSRAGAAETDDLLGDLRALADRVERDTGARRSLEERLAAVEEAEQRAELICDRVALATAERDELFAAAEVDADASFRQVLARWRRRRELLVEREQAADRIHSALGRGDAVAPVLAELDRGDPAGWEAALDEAVDLLPELESQHEDAIRMHHDAARQLEELSRSADVADAALRAESARTRLADAVGEWQTLSAARQLIADTLARYERERQPAVLARAEDMFATVTDGHYRSLAVVEGETSITDHEGRRLTTDDLSRGTSEQLYLCLRFGLAAEMATHAPLPFVMDDVLVNFDPERMERMAGVIAGLADAHQVLLFTCQPSSVEALRAAHPDARVIELPRHGGRS